MNSTVHSAHGESPFKVVFGRDPPLPIDRAFSDLHDCKVHATAELIRARHDVQEKVKAKLAKTNEAMAKQVNRHRRHVEFSVG